MAAPPGLEPAFEVPDVRMPLMVGMGVIGGLVIGSWAVNHMFVEGLTSKERNGILKAVAAGLMVWGAGTLFELDKQWWFNVDSIVEKVTAEIPK